MKRVLFLPLFVIVPLVFFGCSSDGSSGNYYEHVNALELWGVDEFSFEGSFSEMEEYLDGANNKNKYIKITSSYSDDFSWDDLMSVLQGISSVGYIYLDLSDSIIEVYYKNGFDKSNAPKITKLKKIILPLKCTEIGEYAFYNCTGLLSVYAPNTVASIGKYAFGYCRDLDSFTVPSKVTAIESQTFSYCTNLLEVNLPDSITSIGEYAFFYCENLKSITIPLKMTKIGDRAFESCTGLESIVLHDNITSIGKLAFCCCRNLSSFEMPAKVTEILYYAFEECEALKSVNIPSSVTNIGEKAFYDSGLREAYFDVCTGWSAKSESYDVSSLPLTESNLSNPSTAARLLREYDGAWTRS